LERSKHPLALASLIGSACIRSVRTAAAQFFTLTQVNHLIFHYSGQLMSLTASTDRLLDDIEISTDAEEHADISNQDADKRKEVEKTLLWKLDLRVFFLTLVSIMNLVGALHYLFLR